MHRVLPSYVVDEKNAGKEMCRTDLEPMQFGVVVRFGKTGKHEIVGVLEEAIRIVWICVFGVWVGRSGGLASVWVDDTQLDNGWRVNGATVSWRRG